MDDSAADDPACTLLMQGRPHNVNNDASSAKSDDDLKPIIHSVFSNV